MSHHPHTTPHSRRSRTSRAGIRKICITTRPQPTQKPTPSKRSELPASRRLDARNHYPQIKHHTPPPKLGATTRPPPPETSGAKGRPPPPTGQHRGLVVSKPNSVSDDSAPVFPHRIVKFVECTRPVSTTENKPSNESPRTPNPHTMWAGLGLVVLLRKEVIQPHLPVRLPCYDFVPIADPTFDGSLPQGVRPPASGVTDFHDVTGGVYKARERIHRSVADLRLLATPTSRGRVADPDPN